MYKNIFAILLFMLFLNACKSKSETDVSPEKLCDNPSICGLTQELFDKNTALMKPILEDYEAFTSNAKATDNETPNIPTSLRPYISLHYNNNLNGWLALLEQSKGKTFDLSLAPMGDGGLLDKRLLNKYGLETGQLIDKGLHGAFGYNYAKQIEKEEFNEATADKLLALTGIPPTFNIKASSFSGTYLARRSDTIAQNGYYYDIQTAIKDLKSTIGTSTATNLSKRKEAFIQFFQSWEKSNYATAIYYANDTKKKLQSSNGDATSMASAMHSYGELVGFVNGFYKVESKIITDQTIEKVLGYLLATPNEDPMSYKFLKDTSLISNFDKVIQELQKAYGFSDAEVELFKKNYQK